MTWEEALRSKGLRVTRPRLAVLEVLSESRGRHPDVEEITRSVRRRLDSVSTQAIYDVLNALSRAGLARRVEPAGSPARFEAASGDNHHHVVCRGCGAIADVHCATGQALCLHPEATEGFLLEVAEVTFWGLCPRCQDQSAPAPTPADAGGSGSTAAHGSLDGMVAPAGQERR